MTQTLLAGLAAVAFVIITVVLIVARKKWPKLDIPAVVSALAAVAAVVVAILSMPGSPPQPSEMQATQMPLASAPTETTVTVSPSKEVPVTGYNLLQNPGFEQELAGWDNTEVGGVTVSIDGQVFHSGQKSVRILFAAPNGVNFWHLTQGLKLKPDTDYILGGYIKTEGIESARGVRLEVQDSRGWATFVSYSHKAGYTGTQDWTYYQTAFTTPPDTDVIYIFLRRADDEPPSTPIVGTAWFDDLVLVEQ